MGRVVGTLFGLPFAAVGLGMLVWTGMTLQEAAGMAEWQRVDAIVYDGGYKTRRGDDSDTYLAWGEYGYRFAGRDYRSRRVAISDTADNIGSFQQDLGNRLAAAAASGQPIDAWVNPDDPEEAVIDRSHRWGMTLFKLIFGLVFGVVGVVAIWAVWRKSDDAKSVSAAAAQGTPWLANPAWQGGPIRSEAKNAMRGAWLFAGLWNLVSMPLPFLIVGEVTEKQNFPALIGLLFPLVGIGLLVWAVRTTREWQRFGVTPLELDPFPGAIGGHVGGRIHFNTALDSTTPVTATLTLIRSESGSESRSERAQWQEKQRVRPHASAAGGAIEFRFDVPADLPTSDADTSSGDYYLWRLNIHADLDGADLDRTYTIPVFDTGAQSARIDKPDSVVGDVDVEAYDDAAIAPLFRVHPGGIYPEVHFPMGRHLGMTAMGIVIGAVFGGAGVFLFTQADAPVMGSIFALVGGVILLSSLYSAGSSFSVTRDGASIRTRKRWLGLPIGARAVDLMRIRSYRAAKTMSSQSGSRHEVYYALHLVDERGGEVQVGAGLNGMNGVRAMVRRLTREFGLPELPIDEKRSRSVREVAAAARER